MQAQQCDRFKAPIVVSCHRPHGDRRPRTPHYILQVTAIEQEPHRQAILFDIATVTTLHKLDEILQVLCQLLMTRFYVPDGLPVTQPYVVTRAGQGAGILAVRPVPHAQ